MLYSILCYESEALASSRTRQEDDAMMVRLRTVQQKLASEGKLGPVARLMPTTTATTIMAGKEPRPPKDWTPRNSSVGGGGDSGGGSPAVNPKPSPTVA